MNQVVASIDQCAHFLIMAIYEFGIGFNGESEAKPRLINFIRGLLFRLLLENI